MAPAVGSSGDLIADRRYGWAVGLLEDGDAAAAADLFAQVLAIVPDWLPALSGLADAAAAAGDTDAAGAALSRLLALDPQDLLGAGLRLARIGLAPPPPAPPAAFVRGLFDDYADRFDRALTVDLDYRTPQALADLLADTAPGRHFSRVLDLGCGTGLMAPHLRPIAGHLAGVDLSPRMLARAAGRGLYDSLAEADVVAALAASGPLDLAVAADVLVYVGALGPFLAAAAAALEPGGLLALSLEASGGPALVLRDSLRYAHDADAVAAEAAGLGLSLLARADGTLRLDRGLPVEGHLLILARA